MKIILPGLEGVTKTRHALQQYINQVAEQIGGKTVLVSTAQARSLLETLVVDALTMGMTPQAALAYEGGLTESYMVVLSELFDVLNVTVPFDHVYTDLLDDLVIDQWSRVEPHLDGRVPYDVSVTWLGNNILIVSNERGNHFPPQSRARQRKNRMMLDGEFDHANRASLSMAPEVPVPRVLRANAHQQAGVSELFDRYRMGQIDTMSLINGLTQRVSRDDLGHGPTTSVTPHDWHTEIGNERPSVPHYMIMKERHRPTRTDILPSRFGGVRGEREYVEGEFDHIIEELLPTPKRDT